MRISGVEISEISWGEDNAESDPNLLKYFIPPSGLNKLTNFEKSLIIGRKGAGKSAIRKKLYEIFSTEKKNVVIEILSTNLQAIVSDKNVKGFNEEIFFHYVWLRFLYSLALIEIGSREKGKFATGAFEYARNLATKKGASSKDLVESLSDILTRLKIKAGELGELGLNLEKVLQEESDVGNFEKNLGEILSSMKGDIIFMVDDLDIGWDNSDVANNLLLGLLTAMNHIRAFSEKIHISIFLREDIYQIILKNTTHSDKFRNIQAIKWNQDKLVSLLEERIKFNYIEKRGNAPRVLFEKVFPETIGTSNTKKWLTERTLNRPRELIQFARIYSENNNSKNPDSDILKDAEKQYSEWKLDDLCTEYMFQYPELSSVFSYWKSNFFRYKYHLNRQEINEMLEKILAKSDLKSDWFLDLKKRKDIEGFLKILYSLGFLGDYIKGGDGGNKTVYSIVSESHEPIFTEIQIHPCFRKSLGMVERIRGESNN